MSWVIDALKEPFQKKEKETKEQQLLRMQQEINEELKKMKDIKVSIPVKAQVAEKVEDLPAFEPPQANISTDERLNVLEENLSVIVQDLHERVSILERAIVKMNAEKRD
jgi:uncharacterized small protein (DUF1192 family)